MDSRVVPLEKIFKATHDVKASRSGSTTILFGYIPPQKCDASVIQNNSKYPLVNPSILQGVHVTMNIMDNLKKLTFFYHEEVP